MTIKQCTRCGQTYTRNYLREHTELFLKDKLDHIIGETGLVLFNCPCGTTLGVPAEDLWPCLVNEIKEYFDAVKRLKLAQKAMLKRLEGCENNPTANKPDNERVK